MSKIHEVIIDCGLGQLAGGFSTFVTDSGHQLTQLGLSVQIFRLDNMKLIAGQCKNLNILHLFFSKYISRNEELSKDDFSMPKLEGTHEKYNIYKILSSEGLYLGVGPSCNLDIVHQSLTSKLLVLNIMNRAPTI